MRLEDKFLTVVIGEGSYNDLGMIRSLGEKGLKSVYLTDGEHVIPIKKSKYLLETVITTQESDLSATLREMACRYGRHLILFPASDLAAGMLDQSRQELAAFAVVPHACGQLDKLMDKACQAEQARLAGFEVPQSSVFHLDRDSISFHAVRLPCIVKPLLSMKGSKSHITVCRSVERLQECLRLFKDSEEYQVLVQDLVEQAGMREVCITGVVLQHRKVVVGGIVEKYRTIGNGSTTYGKFSPAVPDGYKTMVAQYLERTSFCGLFDLECFVMDDGRLMFIECNFRNGAYGYAATRAGINLPWLFYADAVEQPVGQTVARDVVFMEERSDVLHVTHGDISWGRWLRDVGRTDTFLFSNRKDPGPMLRVPHIVRKHLPWL